MFYLENMLKNGFSTHYTENIIEISKEEVRKKLKETKGKNLFFDYPDYLKKKLEESDKLKEEIRFLKKIISKLLIDKESE